jgi:hypothetical protein
MGGISAIGDKARGSRFALLRAKKIRGAPVARKTWYDTA